MLNETYHKLYTSTVTTLKSLCTILCQSSVLDFLSKPTLDSAHITQTLNQAAAIYLTV